MSILASLTRAYTRLKDVPQQGYSSEQIGFLVSLHDDGSVAHFVDRRSGDGAKKFAPVMQVPTSFKRSGTKPRPFFLWDNANYALGASTDIDPSDTRFDEFRNRHLVFLEHETDPGLVAFRQFLQKWQPADLDKFVSRDEIRTEKIAFALESERISCLLHQRPRARELWGQISDAWKAVEGKEQHDGVCLVTGQRGPIARTHPAIRGIRPKPGAKEADSIVSFNFPSAESYGHEQGNNAPVSEYAAFAYTTALNRMLSDRDHRIQIGDASTVFWADAEDAEAALVVEATLASMLGLDLDLSKLAGHTRKEVGILLEKLRRGSIDIAADLALEAGDLAEKIGQGVRIHVLGLAPNAARLSIRFYYESDFKDLARNYRDYVNDIRLDMGADDRPVSINRLVLRTAPARRDRNNRIRYDTEQVSPLLSGELFRSILTGDRFPRALLAQTLMRIRSDHHLDRIRVALIKAVIVRDMRKEGRLPKEDYLVRSDPDDPNPARRLGKLFAIIERAQRAALGDDINTNVRDKYLASAAATPAQVMSKLIMYAEQHHIKRLRNGHSDAKWIKDSEHAKRVGRGIGADLGRLAASFQEGFPAQHSDEEQGLFLIGYYQERYGKRVPDDEGDLPDDEETADEGDE